VAPSNGPEGEGEGQEGDEGITEEVNVPSELPTLFSRHRSRSPSVPVGPPLGITPDGVDLDFERLQRLRRPSAADLLAQVEAGDDADQDESSSAQPSRHSSTDPQTPPLPKAAKALYNQSSDEEQEEETGSSPEVDDGEDYPNGQAISSVGQYKPEEPAGDNADVASNSTSSDSEAEVNNVAEAVLEGKGDHDDDQDESSGERQDEEDRIQVQELLSSQPDRSPAEKAQPNGVVNGSIRELSFCGGACTLSD
jgi:hypothetical protein